MYTSPIYTPVPPPPNEKEPAAPEQGVVKTSTGFRKDGVDFPIGCYMYVAAGVFQPLAGAIKDTEKPEYAAKGRFVKVR